MKRIYLLFCISAMFTVPAVSQAPRVFDNFDRSQGVPLYLPPPPEEPTHQTRRIKRNGKWVTVVTEPNLVKRTGSSALTMSVADGLAQRGTTASATKLVMGTGRDLKGFTTGVTKHDEYIVESSKRYNIDPLLIYAQMHQESSFKIKATSHKGASGLMQLMPATARRFGVTKIYDPKQNIDAGVKYMRWLLDTFNGDVVLALAGYNAGEGAVMKYGRNVPPYRETREYVRRITARYNVLSDPKYIRSAKVLNGDATARLDQESRPLTVIEPTPMTIKLPGGKIMLVNQ